MNSPSTIERSTAQIDGSDGSSLIKWFGRFGYAAKGSVYGVIGALALMQLFTAGGKSTGSSGALATLNQQPFGDVLLYLIAFGLILYTLWRFSQGILDVENKGSDASDLVQRSGLVISGALYSVLAWQAISLAMGSGGGSSSGSNSERAQDAMAQPGGTWLVVAVGVGFLITALYQLWRAWSLEFTEHWRHDLSGELRRRITQVSRFGIAARAVILAIMGGYIAYSGLTADASEVKGLGGVLKTFTADPWLLGTFAIGITCYAIYAWTNAIFRRIPAP